VRRRRCIQPKKSGSEPDSFGVAFMVALRSTPRGGHVDTNAKSTPRRRGNDEPNQVRCLRDRSYRRHQIHNLQQRGLTMVEPYRPKSELLSSPALLVTESKADFSRLRDAFNEDIKPRGPIERMYISEIANVAWETLRLRRFKSAAINERINDALRDIIFKLLPRDMEPGGRQREAGALAQSRFSDHASKRQVLELFKQNNRDESEAEVSAIRDSLPELEQIDRLLASLGSRLNKALRQIFEYRQGFARRLRDTGNRTIEGKVLTLEHSGNKRHRQGPENGD
jgi:hypothetical protein